MLGISRESFGKISVKANKRPVGPVRDAQKRPQTRAYMNADDCVLRLGTRRFSLAMAVEDILWGARPLIALSFPRVDYWRHQADV